MFWIKRNNKITAVNPARILYIEGSKYGCHIFYYPINNSLNEKTIISSSTLAYFETILKRFGFFRCHRNYLVNPLLVEAYYSDGSFICIGNRNVPVSKRKKNDMLHFTKLVESKTKPKNQNVEQ